MVFTNPTLILLGLSGVVFLVMIVAMLTQGKFHERVSRVLLAYLIISLGWVVVQILLVLQILRLVASFDLFALQRISLYLLFSITVIFLQLTRYFHQRGGKAIGNDLAWWAIGGTWLAICIILYENFLRLPDAMLVIGGSVVMRPLAAFGGLVLGWGLTLGSAVIITFLDFQNTVSPLHRNRNMYWSIALTLAIAAQALIFAQQLFFGNLMQLLATLVAAYALLTFNLPDLRMATRGATGYILITLLTIAVYAGGFYAAEAALHTNRPLPLAIVAIVLAVALAVLLNPLLGVIGRFIKHMISGTRYDPSQALSEYSMSISNILDMEVLAAIVTSLISEAMEITHGALVTVTHQPGEAIWEEGNGSYLLRLSSGDGAEQPEGWLSGKNPVVYYLRREHRPLAQYDVDLLPRFQSMEPAERAWLSGLKMDVFIPIYAKEVWIGLLALGPKASGDRYYDDDLAFLQTLADQTAVALENARLYADLKQRNAENERLNDELKTANVELSRLDQAKTDFINIASHELRTPLTQVIGFNDILAEMVKADKIQPAAAVQMTESVRKAARRLEEIVETMFDVSKLDTKTLDLVRAPVSLASVISVSIDAWQKGLEERQLAVDVRGVSNLPPVVADGKRLTQVFSHLIQNAIKSTPNGGQIRISGRAVDGSELPDGIIGAGLYVEVIVADTGVGIAADDLERIFEKFYRVGNVLLHSTGETKFKGAGPGLGLTIARGIVEAHGGHIWAESPGLDEEHCPGARFHVLLPVRTSLPEASR